MSCEASECTIFSQHFQSQVAPEAEMNCQTIDSPFDRQLTRITSRVGEGMISGFSAARRIRLRISNSECSGCSSINGRCRAQSVTTESVCDHVIWQFDRQRDSEI